MATSALRKLLRAVHKHVRAPGNANSDPHFGDLVMAEFRKNAGLSDPALIKQKLSVVEDCAALITSVHYHKDLLRSYNIDVDRSEQVQERLTDTAGRVGLQMPQLYEEEEEECKEENCDRIQ